MICVSATTEPVARMTGAPAVADATKDSGRGLPLLKVDHSSHAPTTTPQTHKRDTTGGAKHIPAAGEVRGAHTERIMCIPGHGGAHNRRHLGLAI
jgi:hypothetical protein